MNEDSQNNQISAWFDDELTAAERASISQRLEHSADARDELTEIERVSEWLEELPPELLPRDFATGVAKLTVRPETHTKPSPVADDARRATVAHDSARPLRWSQGVGIVLSVAAVLFLTATLFFGPDWADESPQRWPVAAADEPSDRKLLSENGDRVVEMPTPAEEANVGFRGANALRYDSSGTPADFTAAPPAERFFDENSRKMAGASATAKNVFAGNKEASDAPASELTFGDNLKRAEIGQVVEALERSAGRIMVVRLTVVDIRKGFKNLHVLLARNRIPQDPASNAVEQQKNTSVAADDAATLPEQDNRLVAVYVKATGAQLTAVFEQIKRESRFQQMKIDPPITVAQLAEATQTPLAFGSRASRSGFSKEMRRRGVEATDDGNRKPLSQSETAESAPKTESAPKLAKDKERSRVKEGPIVLERRQLAELDRISRQLDLTLAPELLAEQKRQQRPSGSRPAVISSKKWTRPRVAKMPTADEAERLSVIGSRVAGTPFQVLFVLEVVPPSDNARPIPGQPATRPAAPMKKASIREPDGAA
jgi:hypothetical protein